MPNQDLPPTLMAFMREHCPKDGVCTCAAELESMMSAENSVSYMMPFGPVIFSMTAAGKVDIAILDTDHELNPLDRMFLSRLATTIFADELDKQGTVIPELEFVADFEAAPVRSSGMLARLSSWIGSFGRRSVDVPTIA